MAAAPPPVGQGLLDRVDSFRHHVDSFAMYAESQSRSETHSAAEVVAAVGGLSAHDLARLRTAARIWIGSLRLDAVAADADDLVQEAIFRTTSGQRSWKVGVDLFKHLREVMRSIVDSWRKSAERRALSGRREVRESDFRQQGVSQPP